MTEAPSHRKSPKPTADVWRVLILLICSFCIFFVSLEIVLRVIGYGSPSERVDPFQGFEGTNRIFQEVEGSDGRSLYVANPNKAYVDQRFSSKKATDAYRIFAFGGSTTEGVPWGRNDSFPAQLHERLQEMIPSREIEVINVGVAGYASSRVLEIFKEMLDYQPDLFVVYTGQNEFRDAHFHKRELRRSFLWTKLLSVMYRSRAVFFILERSELLIQKIAGKRIVSYAAESIEAVVTQPFSSETFQSFDYYRQPDFLTTPDSRSEVESTNTSGGEMNSLLNPKLWMKSVLGKDGWRYLKRWLGLEELSEEEVYRIFEENIRTMIDLANQQNVSLIFVAKAQNPKVMNLQNPYKINPHKFIQSGKVETWRHHYSRGLVHINEEDYQQALESFAQVRLSYRPAYRDLDYLLALYMGECYEQLGQYEQAIQEYRHRLPITHEHLNTLLKTIALEQKVPVLDAQHILAQNTQTGIVGYNDFVDAVHMTLTGYEAIGLALADYVVSQGFIPKHQTVAMGETRERGKRGMADKDYPADVFTSLGWSEFNQGKLEKALFWGLRAVEKLPEDVQAHLLLGYIYAKQGLEDQAKKEWDVLRQLWLKMETH